jgi:Cu+-exporting ATPase
MLTGDNQLTRRGHRTPPGIDDVRAGVLPADKRNVIADLQRRGHLVAMAGDGINDARRSRRRRWASRWRTVPTSLESAGITLVQSDLTGVVRAAPVARDASQYPAESVSRVRLQHARVPIAAGLLHPVAGLLISPICERGNDIELIVGDRGTHCGFDASIYEESFDVRLWVIC